MRDIIVYELFKSNCFFFLFIFVKYMFPTYRPYLGRQTPCSYFEGLGTAKNLASHLLFYYLAG